MSNSNQQPSNQIQLFENNNFGKIRVIIKNGDPWFVAKDVCECLDLHNPRTSLALLDDDEKDAVHSMDTIGRDQEMTTISESGLYSLVLRSRKPEAKQFKRWVTHDVLPSIRKTGSYSIQNSNDSHILKALEIVTSKLDQLAIENKEIRQENQEIKRTIQELVPKVEFYDTVTQSDKTYDMGRAAKIIGKCGRNTLFNILKKKHILMSNRDPYQKYVDNGLFDIVLDKKTLYAKTIVTGKGLQYIKKLLDG